MDWKPKVVKTHEFVGTVEKIKAAQHAFIFLPVDIEKGLNLCKECLGPEMTREETRGKNVIRLFENKAGSLLFARIYDEHGMSTGEYHFYTERDEEADKNEPAIRDNQPHIENITVKKLFDIRHYITNIIKNPELLELELDKDDRLTTFKKIANHNLDIFIRDPMHVMSPGHLDWEREIYQIGYKKIEERAIDPDGIIDFLNRRHFDEQGRFIKEERFTQTPWGEDVRVSVSDWSYDMTKRTVTFRSIHDATAEVREMDHYILGWHDRIVEREMYWKRLKTDPEPVPEDKTPAGLVLIFKRSYVYDEEKRLHEIKTIDFKNPESSSRTLYEYDKKSRLVSEKYYDIGDALEVDKAYEYFNDHQVRITERYYPSSFVYKAFRGEYKDAIENISFKKPDK